MPGRPLAESVWLLGHWSLDLCRNSRSLPLNLHCAHCIIASSVSEGLAICTTFARDLKNKCFLAKERNTRNIKEPYPHIQKSSSSNPALFVPESTFPRIITFIRKAEEKWLFAQQTSTTICTNIKVSRFDVPWKSPAESAWLLGHWSLCHWANPWGNENVCILQHSLSAKLSVQQLCRSFWIFMYSCLKRRLFIRVSLATSYTHKKKNLTNGDGKAWCMILKLQKQIQRDISSSMVLLSSSFRLVLLDY